jgi:hypothetical protein
VRAADVVAPATLTTTRKDRDMAALDLTHFTPPSQVFVPVVADGHHVLDNGGDVIATCFTPELAAQVARLLNGDAGAAR